MYIEPTLHIHSTLADAKDFLEKYGAYYFWSDKPSAGIPDVVQGRRTLIVGEPGVGKTLLLEKVQDFLKGKGVPNRLIALKERNAIGLIDQCISDSGGAQFALLLDGLDEAQGSLFPSILQKIEGVSKAVAHIAIYIASRSVFMNRFGTSFPEYRVITLSPFTPEQVREYLAAAGHQESQIGALLNRIMSFSHNMMVVQVPRYLFLLNEFLSKKQIASVGHGL